MIHHGCRGAFMLMVAIFHMSDEDLYVRVNAGQKNTFWSTY